jgi:hypothetical protein
MWSRSTICVTKQMYFETSYSERFFCLYWSYTDLLFTSVVIRFRSVSFPPSNSLKPTQPFPSQKPLFSPPKNPHRIKMMRAKKKEKSRNKKTTLWSRKSFRPLVTLKNDCKTKSLAYYESTGYDNLIHVSIVRFHNICFNLCITFQNTQFSH